MENCLRCNSEKVIPKVVVEMKPSAFGQNGFIDFQLAVDGDPDAFIFRERERSDVSARVCGDCGFTEFYATKAQNLYHAYQKSIAERG
jgi:predicted nucleic-acid-binding Zn-ribbon protein